MSNNRVHLVGQLTNYDHAHYDIHGIEDEDDDEDPALEDLKTKKTVTSL